MRLEKWSPELLPDHPSIAIIGKRRSGKSILLKSICYEYFKRKIAYVYVFSQTSQVNGYFDKWIPDKFIFSDINEEVLENIITRQEALTKMNRSLPKHRQEKIYTLLIFDDIGLNDARYSRLLHKIFLQGRHLSIGCVFLIQDATMISRVQRDNLDTVITFNLPNKLQRDRIVESYLMINDKEEGEDLLKAVTSRQYYVLVIDNTKTNSYELADFCYWYKSDIAPNSGWKMGNQRQWYQLN